MGTLGVASSLFSLMSPLSQHFREKQTNKAPEGFEPSTLRLLGVRSNQLSYGAACCAAKERSRQDSNLQPLDPRSNALPLSHATGLGGCGCSGGHENYSAIV